MTVAALIDACVSDLRSFRIGDRDWMLVCLAFLLLLPGFGSASWLAWHVGAALVVFAAGAALFALGAWGGGDVKLCAALALLTGFAGLPRFLFVMALAGGVIALAVLVLKGRKGDRRVPYGLAIATAGLDWAWFNLVPHLAI